MLNFHSNNKSPRHPPTPLELPVHPPPLPLNHLRFLAALEGWESTWVHGAYHKTAHLRWGVLAAQNEGYAEYGRIAFSAGHGRG
jgi:hypothetical protein